MGQWFHTIISSIHVKQAFVHLITAMSDRVQVTLINPVSTSQVEDGRLEGFHTDTNSSTSFIFNNTANTQ